MKMHMIPSSLLLLAALSPLAGCGGAQTETPVETPAPTPPPPPAYDGPPLVHQQSESPIVEFRLVFDAGSIYDPPGKEGLSNLTAALVAEGGIAAAADGSGELTYDALLKRLHPWAAQLGVQVDKSQVVFVGRCHTDHLEAFSDLLMQVMTRPRLGAEDFERLKQQALQRLVKQVRTANDEELSKLVLEQVLFEVAAPAYAHPALGTEAGLNAITLDDVKAHRSQWLSAPRLTVGLAGGIDEAKAQAFAKGLATGLGEPAKPLTVTREAPTQTRPVKMVIVEQPDAQAAAISIGHRLPLNRAHDDFPALALMASYFGEHRQFHGVLFQRMREARGMNYGDYAYVEAFRQEGWGRFPLTNTARNQQHFSLWIRPVPVVDAHFATRIALWHLKKMLKEGIPEKDFEATRGFLSGYEYLKQQTNMRRLGYALDDRFYGLDTPHADRMRDMWASMSAADVNAAVNRHINPKDLVIVIVTKDAKALAQKMAANTASPKEYTSPKPEEVLAEDKIIEAFPLDLPRNQIRIIKSSELFAK
ncbi:MAG: M16 family metallopeptidase [Bradymonadia bacterium]